MMYFSIYKFFYVVYVICLIYFLCLVTYFFFLLVIAFLENRRRDIQHKDENYNTALSSRFTIPVSILIPALNEEKTILNCVKSALNQDYPEFEVIVVSDGSTDRTVEILAQEFNLTETDIFYRKKVSNNNIVSIYKSGKYPNLTVVNKRNGGQKAAVLNNALDFSRYRYICSIDADTVLEKDAVLKTMRPILREPDKIVGAGSLLGILNGFVVKDGKILKRKFSRFSLSSFQTLEYIRSHIGNRLSLSRFRSMLCICGGFGVWRKDFLLEIGGYSSDFTCEDIEITFRAHDHIVKNKKPYKIIMLPHCVAWTEGPSRIKNLIKQRNRWQRVTNETVWHYRHMLFNPKYGWIGFLGAPYYLFYESLGIFFELASIMVLLWGTVLGYVALNHFLLILAIMILCYSITTLVSLLIFDKNQRMLSLKDLLVFAGLSFLEFFGYRQIISIARVLGTIDFIRGDKKWHKFERNHQTTY
ncbi:MAG: glycosyltransferase family 2 protein [Candidatus Omnitrophica bacterium]|nr:glycosyltransferase family 2 protein [Candidatus Omnitrophota bacterium]